MPGSNAGTGHPLWFRCTKCRKANPAHARERYGSSNAGWVSRVVLTGKVRDHRHAGPRMTRWAREYRCDDCGHVGWSRHIDLERKALAKVRRA